MSQQLINHSSDLKRLRDEGYDVEVRSNYLLIKHVPYVNSGREIKFGILVSDLSLAGNLTTKPGSHVAYFSGEHPCNTDGSKMAKIIHQSVQKTLGPNLVVHHSFSSKPRSGYADYYQKMTTYAAIISGPALSINPDVTAKTFPVIEADEGEFVFNYLDTASSRAEINIVTKKLELRRVGIVGLGGTGSYVLDLIAKTPIKEVCIFDGDDFLQHNAFRSPGAPSIEELREKPKKVAYFRDQYSKMHRNIVAYDGYIDDSNIDQLEEMDFVFLCLDGGEAKRLVVEKLEAFGVPFIDVGMGIELVDDALLGVLRITTSTVNKREHVRDRDRISFSDGDPNNEYSKNIQIADLNALNAALSVIKWKKLFGFYKDFENEHFSTYTIDGNALVNEDKL
ncbi:MAG: ThiF family adenylyltransferase [Deltaproteobacteria bacterium]|nr:ThiF family adenylyltransferase [Deltaproteobacteria bacterium]